MLVDLVVGMITVRSSATAMGGDWNHLMSELTSKSDSTDSESQKKNIEHYLNLKELEKY
jgi:hypothetical protein